MTLDQQQAEDIAKTFAAQYKNWLNTHEYKAFEAKFRRKEAVNPDVFPEYWPGYNDAVAQFEAISVHFTRGKFPEKAFRLRAPNQTFEEMAYVRENFKSITLSVPEDFVNTINRGTNRNNWTLEYAESNEGRDLKEYVEKNVPKFGSIEGFWSSIIPDIFLQDANGILVIRPDKLDYVKDENGEILVTDGMVTIDNTDLSPVPYYYSSPNIVGQNLHEWYLCITPDKSLISTTGGKKREGIVLELYDDIGIWRIEQTGTKSDYTFSTARYFIHNLEKLQAKKLGGRPVFDQRRGLFFNSNLNSVVDLLDMAAIDNMMLFLIKKKSIFPYRVALGDLCEFEKDGQVCDNGYFNFGGDKHKCTNCNGFGVISRVSIGGEMIVKPSTDLSQGDSLKGDMIKYVSPPIDTPKFLKEEIESALREARKQIHLRSNDQQATGGVDTATGVLSEMKSMQAFLRPIIYQLFDLFEFMLTGVAELKFGKTTDPLFRLNPPQDLDISTPGEYLAMIKEAREGGAPALVIQQLMSQYLKSVEFSDPVVDKAYRLIIETDDLLTSTPDQIAINGAAGIYQKWQRYLHDSSVQLVYKLYNANNDFFEQEFSVMQDQLIKAAQDAVPEDNTQFSTDNILRLATNNAA